MERLVAIVIIGLLASLAAPRLFGRIVATKVQLARSQIEILDRSVTQYRLDTGSLPESRAGLSGLMTRPAGAERWDSPYLKRLPLDLWEHSYVHDVPGRGGRDVDIVSYGEDGAFGGTGAAADIGIN